MKIIKHPLMRSAEHKESEVRSQKPEYGDRTRGFSCTILQKVTRKVKSAAVRFRGEAIFDRSRAGCAGLRPGAALGTAALQGMKLLAAVIALTLAVCMFTGQAAMSSGQTGSITIKSSDTLDLTEQDLKAYKIFDAVEHNGTFHYTPIALFDGFEGNAALGGKTLLEYLAAFDPPDLTPAEVESMNRLARALFEYISSEEAGGVSFSPVPATPGNSPGEMIFRDLPLGYYLVRASGVTADGETVHAIAALTTTQSDEVVEIRLKADAPTIDKMIWNAHTGAWDIWNDTSIGSDVLFKLRSTVPSMEGYEIYHYIIEDKMSPGLTFKNDIEIYMNAERGSAGSVPVPADYYDISISPTTPPPSGGETEFTIAVHIQRLINDYGTGVTDLYTHYSATLNEHAIIELPGNPNDARLRYSNNPYDEWSYGETPWHRVKAYTGWYSFIKVESEGSQPLGGAEFRVYKEDEAGGSSPVWFKAVALDEIRGQLSGIAGYNESIFAGSGIYMVAADNADGAILTLTTNENTGKIILIGFGASAAAAEGSDDWDGLGSYILVETEPPTGYYKSDDIPIQLRITPVIGPVFFPDETHWDYTHSLIEAGGGAIAIYDPLLVPNTSWGGEIPGTGSIGDTVLFIGSITLMCAAVAGLLIFATRGKRRKQS